MPLVAYRSAMKYPCQECPEGYIASETATCPQCGAVYKRGYLVQRGKIVRRPRQTPTARSHARYAKPPCEGCGKRDCAKQGDPVHMPFTSRQVGATREAAIENLWKAYDARPGKRRRPAREAFEVLGIRSVSILGSKTSGWVIRLRAKA